MERGKKNLNKKTSCFLDQYTVSLIGLLKTPLFLHYTGRSVDGVQCKIHVYMLGDKKEKGFQT